MDGHALLERLSAEPLLAALCFDLDGVLAPIVERPEDGAVPAETRRELERLAGRYALVAVITGRDGDDARRTGRRRRARLRRLARARARARRGRLGRASRTPSPRRWTGRSRRSGSPSPSTTARAADEQDARRTLEAVAERARAEGFVARFGRKVLEVLPPLEADKGTAVTHLLAERGLRRALYAGDDTTDLDGFRALDGPRARRCGWPSRRPRARRRCAKRPTSSSRPRRVPRAPAGPVGLAHPRRGAVGADLRPVAAHIGGVEAHREDRVAALRLRLLDHPAITCSRLSTSAFVIPFSSPPRIDLKPAPICEPRLRERTVSPNTSPSTSWIS